MPISLLTNFTVNQSTPIDDRLVVTNSSARDAIVYKYDGLTVFKTDDRTSWTYNSNSATWSYNISGNGIYAGSGALIGDTNVYTGAISISPSSLAKKFIIYNKIFSNSSLSRISLLRNSIVLSSCNLLCIILIYDISITNALL